MQTFDDAGCKKLDVAMGSSEASALRDALWPDALSWVTDVAECSFFD